MEKNCTFWQWTFIVIAGCCFFSCNNNSNQDANAQIHEFTQPETVPLEFSEEKLIKWDSVKSGEYVPVVKPLDIEKLPAQPFDTAVATTSLKAPEVIKFDLNSLPGQHFDFAKLPSQSLEFKVSPLGPPTVVAATPPNQLPGNSMSISAFGVPNGLPGEVIGALYYSNDGMLWIGAQEGLFRYDGENLETIVKNNTTSPIITGIVQDKQGNIWYMEIGRSVCKVDLKQRTLSVSTRIIPNRGNISKPMLDVDGNIWLSNSSDSSMAVINPLQLSYKSIARKEFSNGYPAFASQDDNNRIWIPTLFNGIKIIDIAAGKIFDLNTTPLLGSDTAFVVGLGSKNNVSVGNAERICVIHPDDATAEKYGKEQGITKADFCFDLSFDSTGQMWRGLDNGIQIIDFKNRTSRFINQSDGLANDVTLAIAHGKHNNTWIGTPGGLRRIGLGGKSTFWLADTRIISLLEDNKSSIWLATNAGVGIIDSARKHIRILDRSKGLSNDFVQSFSNMGDKIAVATNGGLNIIDVVNNTITQSGRKEGIGLDTIYAAMTDSDGNLWITGPNGGVATLNIANKSLLRANVQSGLSDDNISDVKQDREGNIWLATSRGGVNIINPAKGTVKFLNKLPGLKDTSNRMLCLDSEGRVWIGTAKGIYVADTRNKTITNITTANGLSNDKVLSLIPHKNAVLAGTMYKVNIVVPPPTGEPGKKWEVSLLEGSQELQKKTTSWATDCITKSGDYLWGDIGITVVPDIRKSVSETKVNITGITIMNQLQHFYDRGSVKNIDHNDTTNKAAGISFDGLGYADNRVYKWDSISGPHNLPVDLTIPYKNNFLQFQFAELNNGRSDSIFYKYFLEGIDQSWSAPTLSNKTENYLNLPPGRYVFKVVSKGYDGNWSEPASVSFTISPPWYKSWWAYLLYILLGAVLLRAYIVFRSRKLKRENKLLEEKVSLRTKQLEESIEGLKLTQTQLIQAEKMASLGELTAGIAHEIQNPLNFVNNFSELNKDLIIELKEEIQNGNFDEVKAIADNIESNEEKINYHGKRADSIVKGMLQHSRNSSGQKELTDVNQLCDEYLRLAYHGLRAKDKSFNASFETRFDERLQKVNLVPQDIGRVLLNLINNAFYAVSDKRKVQGDEYKPVVEVSTALMDRQNGSRYFEIRVMDNGSGIPENLKDKIFQPFFTTKPTGKGTGLGLSLSYDIVRAHDGQLILDTATSEGTTFIIKLPV